MLPTSRRQLRRALLLTCCAALLTGLLPTLPAAADPATPPPTVVKTVRGMPERAAGATWRTSEAIAAPTPFTLVAFEAPGRAQVQFRTSPDGSTWSEWQDAPTYAQEGDVHAPEDGGPAWGRATEPIWTGPASHLQTRLRRGSPRQLVVHVIDSEGQRQTLGARVVGALSSAWLGLATTAPAEAAAARPAIVSRKTWGAGASRTPTYMASVKGATLHHTAGSNSYTCAQAPGVVRGIWTYHAKTLGWGDIGYHFIVDKCGTIYEGRAGGVDRAVLGAHSGGFNTSTFGVSILGSFGSTLPSTAAREAVAKVVAWKFSLHGIKPGGSVTLTSGGSTKYKSGVKVTLPTFFGHRQVSATACPGDALYGQMATLRSRVAKLMGTTTTAPAPAPAPKPAPSPTPTTTSIVEPKAPPALRWLPRGSTTWVNLNGATVTGDAVLRATPTPTTGVRRIELRLDTALDKPATASFAQSPYQLPWMDTTTLANGAHTLTARLVTTSGKVHVATAKFTVSNKPPALLMSESENRSNPRPLHGATLNGRRWVFSAWQDKWNNTDRVEFRVNAPLSARPTHVERHHPYDLGWFAVRRNGIILPNGTHTITTRVVRKSGRDIVSTATVTVRR